MTIPTVFHNGDGETMVVTRAGRLRKRSQVALRLHTYIYISIYIFGLRSLFFIWR